MPRGTWIFDPDSGGVKVPEAVKKRTEVRLQQIAAAEFAGRYTRLEIRFRGVFCYVDAYTEPEPPGPNWPPPELAGDDGAVSRAAAQHADAPVPATLLRPGRPLELWLLHLQQ